jgi:hypothetical protein
MKTFFGMVRPFAQIFVKGENPGQVRPAEKGPTSVSCYSIALAQNWKTILWIGGIDFCDFLLRQRRALLP